MLFDDYKSNDFRGARLAVDAFLSKEHSDVESHGMMRRLYFVKKKSGPVRL